MSSNTPHQIRIRVTDVFDPTAPSKTVNYMRHDPESQTLSFCEQYRFTVNDT